MTPVVTAVRLPARASRPATAAGPGPVARHLGQHPVGRLCHGPADAFDVVGWDLPGHGHNRAVPEDRFTMAELAEGVLAVVDDLLMERGEPGAAFNYAGVSVGGAVGLQLLLDVPDRMSAAVLLCTAARIGDLRGVD